jgi:hypothetical protein
LNTRLSELTLYNNTSGDSGMPNQKQLDRGLARAIIRDNIPEIEVLIEQGANPLAVLISDSKAPGQPFLEIFRQPNLNTLNAVLNASLKIYQNTGRNIIDLSRYTLEDVTECNLLQYVVDGCGQVPFIDRVIKYAEATKQNVKRLLNVGVAVINGAGTELAFDAILLRRFSLDMVIANLYFMHPTAKENKAASQYLGKWMKIKAGDSDALPEVNFPIRIAFHGPLKTLEYLIDQGLDLKSVRSILPEILAASKDPAKWEDFKVNMPMYGITPTSVARKHDDGLVEFDCELDNCGNKIPAVITLNYEPLNEMVSRKLKELAAAKANGSEAITTLFEQQKKLNAKLDRVQELRLEEIRANIALLPKVKNFFNSVYDAVKDRIQARKMAATTIFTANPTTQEAKIVAMAVKGINVIGDGASAVPFATLALTIISELVAMRSAAHANTQSQGVKHATSGKNIERVAIDVAVLLTCAAMQKYKNDISDETTKKTVVVIGKQIDKLYKHKYQFEDEAGLGYFLMQTALESLALTMSLEATKSHDSNSSGSTSAGKKPSPKLLLIAKNISDDQYPQLTAPQLTAPQVKVVSGSRCGCVIS